MSRTGLTSGMVTAISEDIIRPIFIFEGTFASSSLRLWDGYGDLSWNSQTWLGNGWFKGLSDVAEDEKISSKGIDVLLSGVPQSLISLILSEQRHSARGKVWLGCLNSSGAVISDPYMLFEGGLSSPRINDSSDTAQIVLSYEDDLIILQKSKELRYNNESQRALFPLDKGFEYVGSIQDWKGFWGNQETELGKK